MTLSLLEILERTENESYTKEVQYTQQQGITGKPTIVAGNENLKEFPLKIKLHYSFCNPQKIIDEIETKITNHEVIDYFVGAKYIGKYVIKKIEPVIVERINGTITCAEISVDLLESGTKNTKFEQQSKLSQKINNNSIIQSATTYANNSNTVTNFLQNQSSNIKNNMIESILNVVSTENIASLPNIGQTVAGSVANNIVNDVNKYGINNLTPIANNYSNKLNVSSLTEEQQNRLKTVISHIPTNVMNTALRGGIV